MTARPTVFPSRSKRRLCHGPSAWSPWWLGLLASSILLLLGRSALAADLVIRVLEDTTDRIVLRYEIQRFDLRAELISGKPFAALRLDGGRLYKDVVGAPELPRVCRSVALPPEGQFTARVEDAQYHELSDLDVAPSKGILKRSVDPAAVPLSFGAAYGRDEFFPGQVVSLREPYILRAERGAVVELYPFQYNPVARTLRVYDAVTVVVERTGAGGSNVLGAGPARSSLAFDSIYRARFVNYSKHPHYAPVKELGSMLIIANDDWLPNVQPLVEHKNLIGIETKAVGVSTIGNDATSIQAYIQSAYDTGDLAFVLLVGDASQVATPQASGGASDPSYAKLAGHDDYPDILVGRFSAETAADVDTQVERTVEYEQMPATTQDWFKRAIGIGSDQGPGDDGELDYEHIDKIRTLLVGYDYTTVDQIYDPGATAAQVSAALNEGRGLVNYCGHGAKDSFVTTGFSMADIGALDNVGKLPFIWAVACNTGEFNHGTSFGEAWLRATRNGAPIGAIGAYMSSISQSWDPPMAAQDEADRLLTQESYFTYGGLSFAGSEEMLDEYGDAGVEMFNTWILFGDPSLRVFGVAKPASGLGVEPFDDIVASGDPGGPFSPPSVLYTLHNYSTFPIDWAASASAPWVSVSPGTGTLAPGSEIDVAVSFADFAQTLGNGQYADMVSFANTTDHTGDTTRNLTLTLGHPTVQYEWPLDQDPGWQTEGGWAFGKPLGGGGQVGSPDPTSGHSGDNVYGYNLAGDYSNSMPGYNLTTEPFDCSKLDVVSLRYWRWLGVEGADFDKASISLSTDGQTWTSVWDNTDFVADSAWTEQEIDLSALAARQPSVQLRWTMGPTDKAYQYCGWNIDDIQILGMDIVNCWDADGDGHFDPACGGDDCNDHDATMFPGATENCTDGIDNNCDGLIDSQDPMCAQAAQGGQAPATALVPGGGCSCRAAGRNTTRVPLGAMALAVIGAAAWRRRRAVRPRAGRSALA